MPPISTPEAPFGRILTAMVTPFLHDGSVDLDGAQKLANHLVEAGNDGLVVHGTTGESPTTTDAEKDRVVRAVVEAVGDRAHVVVGVGTNDTAHSVRLARAAASAGASGALVVTPYYNKPPQAGLLHHFSTVAEASDLPVMLYDVPGRTGVTISTETYGRLAENPRIVATKDATGDLPRAAESMRRVAGRIAWYSGDDALTLPMLSIGGVGVVSVIGHLVSPDIRAMVDAYVAGDTARARELNNSLVPVVRGVMTRTQGVIAVKAMLAARGLPGGTVRGPLVEASPEIIELITADLAESGAHF